MVTVDPRDGSDVDGQIERFHAALMTALSAVLERTARRLDPHDPVHSVNIMRTFWSAKVDGLMTQLETVVTRAADHVRDQLQAHVDAAAPIETNVGGDMLRAQLAAAGRRDVTMVRTGLTADLFEVPSPAELFAEIYLRSRRGFLQDLGTYAWNSVRTELIAGLNAGESIGDLRTRVTSVADVTRPRAERIARTEVVGAMNAGSIAQVRASKLDSTKTWLATKDSRTRPSHVDVNGDTVDLDKTFLVGGVRMDRPHDPTAPPDEVIQCRCTLTFEIGDDALTAALEQLYSRRQPRDKNGRWSRSGTLGGGKALDHTREHVDTLEGKQKAALVSYGSDGYTKINGGLRKAKGDTTKMSAKTRDETAQLDQVFTDLKPLTQHIGVHRGMNHADKILGTTDPAKLKGMTITDHGFMSTTPHEDVTRGFAYAGTPATFNITVPAGKKALNVEKALGEKDTFEPEIMLPRGTSLRIIGARKTGRADLENERLVIDAEVV